MGGSGPPGKEDASVLDWRVVEVRELGQGGKEGKTFPRVGSHRVTPFLTCPC